MVHVHVVAWYGVVHVHLMVLYGLVLCGSCAFDAAELHITSPDPEVAGGRSLTTVGV